MAAAAIAGAGLSRADAPREYCKEMAELAISFFAAAELAVIEAADTEAADVFNILNYFNSSLLYLRY